MSHKQSNWGRYIWFVLVLLASACMSDLPSSDSPVPIQTIDRQPTDTPFPLPTSTIQTSAEVEAQPTVDLLPTATQELTFTPTPTPSPSATPTLSVTPTATPSLQGPLIGFRVDDGEEIYLLLFDISLKVYREIRNSSTNYPFEVEWVDTGCGLYLGDIIDLKGNVVWEGPDLDWEQIKPHAEYGSEFGRLSPNRQWLAYDILYGERYYEGAEFRDIGVVNLTNPSEFALLTHDGSASVFAWSPDSEWLAYARRDAQGVNQLYRSTPDGQNEQQLTFHLEPFGVGFVAWSPDGRFIAYAIYGNAEGEPGGMGIVDLENSQQFQIMPHEDFRGVGRDEMWWELEGTRLLFSGTSWNGEEEVTEIYWVDGLTGTITNSFIGSNGPNGFIRQVFPVGNVDHILFSSRGGYYLLDTTDNNSFEKYSDQFEIDGQYYDSEVTPFGFPGEEMCGN
ncbi:MAG: PD40 domain-containing protein [Anaerolineae bacterium]|nr:PD40 domain-containing protein [Anaerolineae bacterium]